MSSSYTRQRGYANFDEKPPPQPARKGLWIGIGITLVVIAAALGGGLGYHFSHLQKTSSSSPSASSPQGIQPSTGNGSQTISPLNGTGPTFPLNSAYTRSFWGLDYTALNTQYPACGATQDEINADLQILYQLTPRIRVYGMDCTFPRMIFEGMKQLNINMGIVLTIWVDKDEAVYQRQLAEFWSVMATYNAWDNLIAISIGNEALFDKLTTLPNLEQKFNDMKANLTALGHGDVPLLTSEASDDLKQLAQFPTLSVLGDNVHPYFAPVSPEQGANWTFTYYQQNDVSITAPLGKTAIISETGWPTCCSNDSTNPVAVPSVQGLQTLLNTWVCQANAAAVPYYFFEFKDEPWKAADADVEQYWGIHDPNNNIKPGLVFPNCPLPLFTQRDGKGS